MTNRSKDITPLPRRPRPQASRNGKEMAGVNFGLYSPDMTKDFP